MFCILVLHGISSFGFTPYLCRLSLAPVFPACIANTRRVHLDYWGMDIAMAEVVKLVLTTSAMAISKCKWLVSLVILSSLFRQLPASTDNPWIDRFINFNHDGR